jgi:hypothetical protein
MKKAKLTALLILLQAGSALPALAAAPSTALKPAQIHGTVEFVQRNGVAPGTMESMNYWGVVVRSNGVDYQLPNVAGITSEVRPESVIIQGKQIHRGDEVTIDGKANKLRKDFGLLSDIQSIDIN